MRENVYLLWFVNENVEFRLSEIESLLQLFEINIIWIDGPSKSPFWIVELSPDDVLKIASRSITLRSIIRLWGSGKTVKELHDNIKNYPKKIVDSYLSSEMSFRIKVETFGKTFTMKEKVNKIEMFSYLPVQGPVKLNNPDVTFFYIEYYGLEPSSAPEKPYSFYFGVWISDGQRHLISKYSLKTRKFIGNTSMDPQLSLIMANQALVKKDDFVMDPFVGTGSLLVAAAHFGAYVIGTDIDYLMLHGKTRPSRIQDRLKSRDKDESIYSNMKQYNTEKQYIDVIVGDSSLPIWHHNVVLDSIITDPPYGIREASEKIGSNRECKISENHLQGHIPSKIDYSLSQIFLDLLQFAAKHLKVKGRLVTWIPILKKGYEHSKLPQHPCLKLIANSEQSLTGQTSRRLLTYEKKSEITSISDHPKVVNMFPLDFRKHYFGQGETRKQRRARLAQDLNLKKNNYSINKFEKLER